MKVDLPVAYPAFSLEATRLTPARLRVRVPDRRWDRNFFDELSAAASRVPGVIEVSANPATGSLLLIHDRDGMEVLSALAALQMFRLLSRAELPPRYSRTGSLTAKEADALACGAYAALALMQAMRGFPFGPGSTLLKQAQNYWDRFRHEQGRGRI
jgi:hypothetical protein